jgi:hypothetical protein
MNAIKCYVLGKTLFCFAAFRARMGIYSDPSF